MTLGKLLQRFRQEDAIKVDFSLSCSITIHYPTLCMIDGLMGEGEKHQSREERKKSKWKMEVVSNPVIASSPCHVPSALQALLALPQRMWPGLQLQIKLLQ